MAKPDEIRGAFAVICAVFPAPRGETPATLKTLLDIWIGVLADVLSDRLSAAVEMILIEDREFRPSPGSIRSRAFDLDPLGHPAPDEAWQIAQRYVSACDAARGSTSTLPAKISDHLVRRTYEHFTRHEWAEGNLDGLRRDFFRAYREALERTDRERRLPAPVRALMARNRESAIAAIEASVPAVVPATREPKRCTSCNSPDADRASDDRGRCMTCVRGAREAGEFSGERGPAAVGALVADTVSKTGGSWE